MVYHHYKACTVGASTMYLNATQVASLREQHKASRSIFLTQLTDSFLPSRQCNTHQVLVQRP